MSTIWANPGNLSFTVSIPFSYSLTPYSFLCSPSSLLFYGSFPSFLSLCFNLLSSIGLLIALYANSFFEILISFQFDLPHPFYWFYLIPYFILFISSLIYHFIINWVPLFSPLPFNFVSLFYSFHLTDLVLFFRSLY